MSNAYIHKADDSLESIQVNIKKEWKIATAYYTIYFSLYAILMRVGIKSEIHSCTVDFVKEYLNDYFNKEEIELIEDSLKQESMSSTLLIKISQMNYIPS
ncbi:MAG TPA: hypothetical protein P5140_08385 [Methanofastidiosum sp.]|nr:hypothetical protein [Methanofastidiosum sp.]HRS26541.1 hypothetical protein [Methanofastidiosum sp.]